jgi:hypothetical protein
MRLTALWVAGIFFASTSIALAADIRASWTESKAEKIVTRDATVRLSAQERTSLESELRAAVIQYRLLEQTAAEQEGDYGQQASRIHNLRYKFSTALKQVQRGVAIEEAACNGTGAASSDNRYRQFRCAVTSELIRIPSAQVLWDNDRISEVVESEPRIEGPFRARLDIRITGKSTIAHRQISYGRVSRP